MDQADDSRVAQRGVDQDGQNFLLEEAWVELEG